MVIVRTKSLFAVQAVIGVLMVFMSGVESARPYALLDQFLTRQQLLDEKVHDAALKVMQKSQRYDSTCWLVGGLIVATTAITGLQFGRGACSRGVE
jgi:hypothetical protein